MDAAPECPHGHGPMEAISPMIAAESLHQFVSAANKYLRGPSSIFSADVLEEAIKKHDIAKHKIDLLLRIEEKRTTRFANEYEAERARFWGYIQGATTRLRTQQQDQGVNKDAKDETTDSVVIEDDDAINKQGTSGKDERPPPDPVVIRNAKRAIVKYTKICKREIRERDDSWYTIECSLEVIDEKYKKARDVVKKAIDAATNAEDDQTEKVDKAQAERLLQHLRTVWVDARHYFLEASDDIDYSDMEEEYELGLL
ncbi:hypothetical protein F4801DRAFT_602237 [Xylaria longipes]|nr:hypothetical protein F4801DRAFT_602237 [Xylaria longipes]RYC58190.1 hypothetical protein CHU98_g8025 [Xylaria longipes]